MEKSVEEIDWKKSLHVWLGHTGKWKKEKAAKPRKPRGKNKLPEFLGDLSIIYTSKTAFTHYYTESRVTKGLTQLEKSAVESGALLVYQAEKKFNGTRWRKVVKYAGCYVPRMMTEDEYNRLIIQQRTGLIELV